MSEAMKFIKPILGIGETAAGVATMNPALIGGGVSTLGSSIPGLVGSTAGGRPPQLTPTMPTQGPSPDTLAMFGGGSSGISDILSGNLSAGGGMGGGGSFGSPSQGIGGGPTFGGLGGNFDLASLIQILTGGGNV